MTDMSEPLTLPPCRICTGIATGIHYGIHTCEACKAFFRRASVEKNKYSCQVNNDCVITDRRRGNCSACRLQKCLDLGMSKGAVRHGRYTIAIRTKTIMEVKRLEGKEAVSSSDLDLSEVMERSPRDEDVIATTPHDDSDGSNDSNAVTSSSKLSPPTPPTVKCKRKSERLKEKRFNEDKPLVSDPTVNSTQSADDMLSEEAMQKIINLLITAQDKIYPNLIDYFNKDYMDKMQKDFLNEYTLKKEVFGLRSNTISKEEHEAIYTMTGIDIDDRLQMLKRSYSHSQRGIIKYITYAKVIPGFNDLSEADKLALIKTSRFEYWLLGHYLHMNPDLGVSVGWEIKMHREESIKYWGSEDGFRRQEDFARTMFKLNLSYEEIAVLRGIVILFRDRCPLDDPDQVEKIQWRLVQCLKYVIQKVHPGEDNRFHMYLSRLVEMRTLTEITQKANKMVDDFRKSLIKNYPIVYECLYS